MRFVLVRHAQSENNRLWAEGHRTVPLDADPGLSELGTRQARALADSVAGWAWRPTHLYTSLMARAIETAGPLADALDLPLRAHELLHEVGGPYVLGEGGVRVPHPGSGRAALTTLSPRLLLPDAVGADGWHVGAYEEPPDAAARARDLVARLRQEHGDDDVVVLVTHGWFTQKLLRALLGGVDHVWFTILNASLTLVADAPGLPCPVEVRCVNDTAHLPHDLLTE